MRLYECRVNDSSSSTAAFQVCIWRDVMPRLNSKKPIKTPA